jgi:F420-non-reducing hydrogenase large subunit
MAHHMASTKALDDLYQVKPTSAGRKIRELIYNSFMLEDHALHVYILGGPDFIVGPEANPALRNVVGVIQKVGLDVGKKVISMRRRIREMMTIIGGKVIHPVLGLPGGVARSIDPKELVEFKATCKDGLEFAEFTLQVFKDIVLKNPDYVKLITSDAYTHQTYYMGQVNGKNQVDFYDGDIRVTDPDGKEFAKFAPQKYIDYVGEHVEPWSYSRFNFLKPLGWKGFKEGKDGSVYSVAPLARLNASDSMRTPKAQAAREDYFKLFGAKVVHHTLANHYARVVEMIQAAELMVELVNDPEITSKDIRNIPTATPKIGIGVLEAPRGTLIHHYETDANGLITKANLIVATQGNSTRMAMSVEKAAKGLIHKGVVSEGLLNKIEMAFRAYDPCHGCSTHSLPGQMPLIATIYGADNQKIQEIMR